MPDYLIPFYIGLYMVFLKHEFEHLMKPAQCVLMPSWVVGMLGWKPFGFQKLSQFMVFIEPKYVYLLLLPLLGKL